MHAAISPVARRLGESLQSCTCVVSPVFHVFYGPDTFTRGEALAALRQQLDTDGMLSANTAAFDGGRVKPDELRAACDTMPPRRKP